MLYRNMALMTGIHFTFDLTTLPAVAEDEMMEAILRKDDTVVIRREPDPLDNPIYRSNG